MDEPILSPFPKPCIARRIRVLEGHRIVTRPWANVLVSAFTTRGLSADVLRLVLVEHRLVTGEVNMEEFRRVLRTRIKVPEDLVTEAEQLIREPPAAQLPEAAWGEDRHWSLFAETEQILVSGHKYLRSGCHSRCQNPSVVRISNLDGIRLRWAGPS